MNIKTILLLLIPITIGIEIQASMQSRTIHITNKTGNDLWVSTQYDLKKADKIRSNQSKDITLQSPGAFAYVAQQELPFKNGSCTTLAITYFKKDLDTFYIYMQRFNAKESTDSQDVVITISSPGMLAPRNNTISGNQIYIHHNPYSSVELTATNSPENPFAQAA